MRIIDIDIAIKELEKEGIDEEADKVVVRNNRDCVINVYLKK